MWSEGLKLKPYTDTDFNTTFVHVEQANDLGLLKLNNGRFKSKKNEERKND